MKQTIKQLHRYLDRFKKVDLKKSKKWGEVVKKIK